MQRDEDAECFLDASACTFASTGSLDCGAITSAGGCRPEARGTSLPGTCVQGMTFQKTGDGSLWFCTASNVWWQIGSATYSATLDFAAPGVVPGCSADLTITGVTNAAVGDPVVLGIPNGSIADATQMVFAWVSASATVKVRSCQLANAAANPASGTFTVKVLH